MKKNLLWVAISFVCFLVCYPFLVYLCIPPQGDVPWMFSTYLLKSRGKQGSNIWIDSGSNSAYSIDAKMLAQVFNRNVYVLSDSVRFPWYAKFYQLLDFVQPGDVVILPMEFEQYVKKNWVGSLLPPAQWHRDDFFLLKGYITYMAIKRPALVRLLDGWHTHPGTLILLLRRYFDFLDNTLLDQILAAFDARIKRLGELEYTLDSAVSLLPKDFQIKEKKDVFNTLQKANFMIRKSLKQDLKILNKLQKKGVTVIWTWPAAIWTEEEILRTEQERSKFIAQVEQLLSGGGGVEGIPLVGTFADSMFLPEAIYDGNYYHINPAYAPIRTQRLIQSLQESGLMDS